MNRSRTSRLTPLLWVAASAGALAALARLGRGDPRFHVPTDVANWPRWWSAGDPLDVAAALGRWFALVLLGYLVVVSLLHLAAALAPRSHVRHVARAATPRVLAGLLAGAVVLAGSSTVGASTPDRSTSTTSTPGRSNPPVMRVIESPAASEPRSETTTTTTASPTTASPTPERSRAAEGTSSSPDSVVGPDPVTVVPTAPPQPETARTPANDRTPPPPVVEEVVVAPGDHLWGIADTTVTRRLGADRSDAQIADYWHRLIELNRDRLVDPNDPSLILPGQRLVLPG